MDNKVMAFASEKKKKKTVSHGWTSSNTCQQCYRGETATFSLVEFYKS